MEELEALNIGILGGLVSGGGLLSYQILLDNNWGVFSSVVLAVFVTFIIYLLILRVIKKK